MSSASIVSFVGCLAGDDPSTSEAPQEEAEEFYTSTVVDLDGGGVVISERLISRTEREESRRRQAELARDGLGSRSDAISQDTDCLRFPPQFPLLRIYDAPNLGGNVICFAGTGITYLGLYCRTLLPTGGCDTWSGNVASYVTGYYSVDLGESIYCGYRCPDSPASTTVSNSACEEASYVWRNEEGCAPV